MKKPTRGTCYPWDIHAQVYLPDLQEVYHRYWVRNHPKYLFGVAMELAIVTHGYIPR